MLLEELHASLPYYASLLQLWEIKQTCHSCTVRRIFFYRWHLYYDMEHKTSTNTTWVSFFCCELKRNRGACSLPLHSKTQFDAREKPSMHQTNKTTDRKHSEDFWWLEQHLEFHTVTCSAVKHWQEWHNKPVLTYDNFQVLNFDWSPSLNWEWYTCSLTRVHKTKLTEYRLTDIAMPAQ